MDVSSHRHFVNLLNKFRAGAPFPCPVVSEASSLVRCQIDDLVVEAALDVAVAAERYVQNTFLEYINTLQYYRSFQGMYLMPVVYSSRTRR